MKKGVLALEIIAIVALIGGAVFFGIKTKECVDASSEGNKFENSKVVLYDGPATMKDATAEDLESANEGQRDTTLKHCTDTMVKVNGYDCYVYDTNVNESRTWNSKYLPSLSRTPITYFDFEGNAEITVTVPDMDIESATVSPLSYGIEPVIDAENHTVTFTIDTVDNYTVQFNGSQQRALHIFTYDIEEDAPSPEDDKVVYFGPGEWNIDDYVVSEPGTTVYISGGAVVHGNINVNFVDDVTIEGHGILDGSYYDGWKGNNAKVALNFNNCKNAVLKDIIVLNPNCWVVQQYNCKNGLIDGLNIISARPNGDGISMQSSTDYEIKNCFIRSWDDSLVVKNYSDTSSENITFSDCQLWTDLAQSMEIGFETNKGKYDNMTIKNIKFDNITVLHNYHKPVISIHNADDAAISDITFSNITVEHDTVGAGDSNLPYIIDLFAGSASWSSTEERGTISDVTIENVNVLSGTNTSIRISGADADKKITNVTFKNVNINGDVLKSTDDANFTKIGFAENITVEADDDFIAAAADLKAKMETEAFSDGVSSDDASEE